MNTPDPPLGLTALFAYLLLHGIRIIEFESGCTVGLCMPVNRSAIEINGTLRINDKCKAVGPVDEIGLVHRVVDLQVIHETGRTLVLNGKAYVLCRFSREEFLELRHSRIRQLHD